jgi:formate hydrogenlyase subunit 3/multisubunit Na+/H+ antiporter MnhD subunit
MTTLDLLYSLAALMVLAPLFIGQWRGADWTMTALYGSQLLILFIMGIPRNEAIPSGLTLSLFDQNLYWRFDSLAWFFALITIGAAFFSAWYATGEWMERYRAAGHGPRLFQITLALNVCGMLLLLGSGNLLTLFIGWEIMSWASFLMMALYGDKAAEAALRYLIYAMGGAMALLGGLALLYGWIGSLEYAPIQAALPQLGNGRIWILLLLFGAGFGVKMALLPLHLWQAEAYTFAPAPGAAFLGAISARMGLFGLIIVLIRLIGITRLDTLGIPFTFLNARGLFEWIAALTIILPTFTALRQNDARMLLAWHGIGQGGYMLLGLLTGSALGSAGGLLHIFNYAACQAALFMSVFAVVHRTGTADLNELGGLVARMPLSFLTMLVGIIGLAGLPPMNGFVSKWMIYHALIDAGNPLLFIATIIGTLGTILSVYKLIHNMFLGQLRMEHGSLNEVPLGMLIPMLTLAALIFISGCMPGLALNGIAALQATVGLPVLDYSLGGMTSPHGSLNMLAIVGVMCGGFGIGAVLFYAGGGRTQRVHPLNNYAGGHFLTAANRYQYSDNFYAGLLHLTGHWYRDSFQWAEDALIAMTDLISKAMQGFYRYAQPALYLLVVTVLLLAWAVT